MTIYDDIINEIDMIYESTFINENTNTTKSTDAYNCISYAMGCDDSILQLKSKGFNILEDDGDYIVKFNSSLSHIWEKFIRSNIQDTYWNEYINLDTGKIVFNIKYNNQLERVVNNGFKSNPKLLSTCNRLCEGNFKSIKELIYSNDVYKKELTKNSNVNESTDCNDFYYRFEYNGVGIYEALKNNISNEEWKCILDGGVLGWLPKPKFYGKNNRSYFTEIGYRMFMKTTYPLIIRYLDDKKIKMSKYQISDNDIVYKDRYQIITR